MTHVHDVSTRWTHGHVLVRSLAVPHTVRWGQRCAYAARYDRPSHAVPIGCTALAIEPPRTEHSFCDTNPVASTCMCGYIPHKLPREYYDERPEGSTYVKIIT